MDPREGRQSPEASPQTDSYAGTPIPTAAGQSKTPNGGSTRTLSPATPPALQARTARWDLGTGDSWCHSPLLQVRHLPESAPHSPGSSKAPSCCSRHHRSAFYSPGAHVGAGRLTRKQLPPPQPAPTSVQATPPASSLPAGWSTRAAAPPTPPRGLANRVCGRAGGSAPSPSRGQNLSCGRPTGAHVGAQGRCGRGPCESGSEAITLFGVLLFPA